MRLTAEERAEAAAMKALLGVDDGAAAASAATLIAARGDRALAVLRAAAKGAKKREEALADLLLRLGDEGCAVADAGAADILREPGHAARSGLVQTIAFDPRRLRLAPALRAIAGDRTDPDWAFAVATLGALADGEALDLLMDQTCGVETPFVVLQALVRLRAPEADLCFEPNLRHPEPRIRTFALWGLAANGWATALGGLIDLLDDADVRTESGFTPGQSVRAAQALADIHGWPFVWGKPAVPEVKARCAERYSAEFVAECRADLAAGRLRLSIA